LLSQIATAQSRVSSGTIIVIAQTKRRVIIASDSRAGQTVNGTTVMRVDDDQCKIATLGKDTVFAAAGILGSAGSSWTATTEATEARTRTVPTGVAIGSAQGDLILRAWAVSMQQRLAVFSPEQLFSYAAANDGHVTTGVLAGIEADGTAWIHDAMINFSDQGGLSYQGYTLTSNDPPTAYYFLGKNEIGMEFEQYKTSERALTERAKWSHMKLKGVAFDRFKARRLVELTIQYHLPSSDVGGPVDEIEVDASGARWIKVKKRCQGVEAKATAMSKGKGPKQ
jgi:hypothetical protein